ncbi:hypothetical protein HaLaN_05532, partial [Haematococcus lacustris]
MLGHRRPGCHRVGATTGLLVCLILQGVFAQLTDVPSAPSPPLLAPRPSAPPLYTPVPQQYNVPGVDLFITFYGLDLWSLVTSWGSRIQALLDAQQPPSLRIQNLTAPGMCASQLLALNTTAMLNTSLTPQELMPALSYFTMDVGQLLRDYMQDSSIMVQVPDFCAGNRTVTPLAINRTLVNVTMPTLLVTAVASFRPAEATAEELPRRPDDQGLTELLLSLRHALQSLSGF